jgi:TolB-like protein
LSRAEAGIAATTESAAETKNAAFISASSSSLVAEAGCLRGHQLGATIGRPSAVWAQRDGDKIFLNFAKRRKIPPVWDVDSRAILAGGRGETGMEALATGETFLFEGFRLDRRGLSQRDEGGGFAPVAIGSRALDVLRFLVKADGDLVSKDEIMAAVWPGTVVEDNNLTVQISALRRILDHGRAAGSCIQTVAGRRYRLAVVVTRHAGDSDISPTRVSVVGTRPPPPLSIVVLPFTNLSNDPDQEYFADGLTDDLTTDLSRIAHSFVISRNTAFTYRNKPVDARQIGRELGVPYVLEGSGRRSTGQVRVNTQLIDAETAAHLWAERFDRDRGDLFALQNEITSRLANAIGVELIAAEAARPTEHPDALDYILRGRAVLFKPRTPDTHREAINLYEHALTLDPQSVEAQSRLAVVLVDSVATGMTDSASAAPDIARAEGLVDRALAASPRYAVPHIVKGHVLRVQNRWEEAIPQYETALGLNHNLVYALHSLGWCKLYVGSIDEVIPLVEQAIRLSPHDPGIGTFYYLIGTIHLLQSHTDEAIVWLEKARSALPGIPIQRNRLRGDTERATAELAEARRLSGGDLFSSIAQLKAHPGAWWGAPKVRALFETTLFARLRMAGMPEE